MFLLLLLPALVVSQTWNTNDGDALKSMFAPFVNQVPSSLFLALGDDKASCSGDGLLSSAGVSGGGPRRYPVISCATKNVVTTVNMTLLPLFAGNAVLSFSKAYVDSWTNKLSSLRTLVMDVPRNTSTWRMDYIFGNISSIGKLNLTACILPKTANTEGFATCCASGTPAIPSTSPCAASFITRFNGGAPQDQCVNCCNNFRKDNGETGVDCGGPCPACMAGNCTNGIQDGFEGGIDCGGTSSCSSCCANGVKDDGETAIDCGGSKCRPCCGVGTPLDVKPCNVRTANSCGINRCTSTENINNTCVDPNCAAKSCGNSYYGWVGNGCRLFEPVGKCQVLAANVQGTCNSTAPTASECAKYGVAAQKDLFTCDVACRKATGCARGQPKGSDALIDVCNTLGETCGTDLVCNSQGRCVPRPTCGVCESVGTTCTAVCTKFPCTSDACTTKTDAECRATVASVGPGVCNVYNDTVGTCLSKSACDTAAFQCTGSVAAIACGMGCAKPSNSCAVNKTLPQVGDVCFEGGETCSGVANGACMIGGSCEVATPLQLFLSRGGSAQLSTTNADLAAAALEVVKTKWRVARPAVDDVSDDWKTLRLSVSDTMALPLRKRTSAAEAQAALLNADLLGWSVQTSMTTSVTTPTVTGTTPVAPPTSPGPSGATTTGVTGTTKLASGPTGSAQPPGSTTTAQSSGPMQSTTNGPTTQPPPNAPTTTASVDATPANMMMMSNGGGLPLGAIIGGAAGGVCLIIIVIIIIVVVRRRSGSSDSSTPHTEDPTTTYFNDKDDVEMDAKKNGIYASVAALHTDDAPTKTAIYGSAPTLDE